MVQTMGGKTKCAFAGGVELNVIGCYRRYCGRLKVNGRGKRNVQKVEFALISVEFLKGSV